MSQEYEIYESEVGSRVNIGEESFALRENPDCSTPNERTMSNIKDGSYGSMIQTYAAACQEAKVKLTHAWKGVVNELGDFGEVFPPWKAREKDFRRLGRKTIQSNIAAGCQS